MPPPRPATEARSGSLEPGRPSRARSANTRHPAGRPHTPPGFTRQTSDRQTSDSIIAECPPERRHDNRKLVQFMFSDAVRKSTEKVDVELKISNA